MNLNDEFRRVFESDPPRPIDRRKRKPDKIMTAMKIVNLTGWLFILAGLFMIYFAVPQQTTILDIYRSKIVRDTWQPRFLYYSFYLLIPGVILSVAAYFLNKRRMKRKSDKIFLTVIAGISVSIIAAVSVGLFIVVRGF